MNALEKAEKLGRVLDEQGRQSVPIRTRSTRNYMMQLGLKPAKRGGELFVGQHPIICEHGRCTQQN